MLNALNNGGVSLYVEVYIPNGSLKKNRSRVSTVKSDHKNRDGTVKNFLEKINEIRLRNQTKFHIRR